MGHEPNPVQCGTCEGTGKVYRCLCFGSQTCTDCDGISYDLVGGGNVLGLKLYQHREGAVRGEYPIAEEFSSGVVDIFVPEQGSTLYRRQTATVLFDKGSTLLVRRYDGADAEEVDVDDIIQ